MGVTFVGFDSAWTDNRSHPGAICAIHYDGERFSDFREPALVSFGQALDFIQAIHKPDHQTLVAIDQPTIVPNHSGMRPCERVAASPVSWLGGGVQPANRSKVGMFDDGAPIWSFLRDLSAVEDPERARTAEIGLYVMEVFPALALAALHGDFSGRMRGPRYNPARRKTFCQKDWDRVVEVVVAEALALRCESFDDWCASSKAIGAPQKSDQDKLDAVICLLVAIRWRLKPRDTSVMVGDLESGYIVAPVNAEIRQRLLSKAMALSVEIDGRAGSDDLSSGGKETK